MLHRSLLHLRFERRFAMNHSPKAVGVRIHLEIKSMSGEVAFKIDQSVIVAVLVAIGKLLIEHYLK
jgi:hypothetical protein